MKIQVSAPGKTILHGEHAVVYGKAAVAVSLSLKTNVLLTSTDNQKVSLSLKNLNLEKEWNLDVLNSYDLPGIGGEITSVTPEINEQIMTVFSVISSELESDSEKYAVVAFLFLWIYISKCYNARSFFSCSVVVESELSVGAGMGSSASYAVCLSTALLILCGRITPRLLPEDKHLINKWAFEAEKIFHGKPSGIDNSICTFGGAVFFKEGCVQDNLTSIPNINILLVDTKISRSTKVLTTGVKQKLDLYPSVFQPIMSAIEGVSNESWKLFQNCSKSPENLEMLKTIQDLVSVNQHLLNAMGVGHKKIDQICEISKKYGFYSKLTGAGGGGCVFVILPNRTEETEVIINNLVKELCEQDFSVWNVFLGGPGVQVQFYGS